MFVMIDSEEVKGIPFFKIYKTCCLFCHLCNYLFLLCLSELCQCFNIDVKNPRIFSGPEDALFGFSVLQHESDGEKS